MAITRGQMQRQLRENGGIMNVTPRENFGLGSSIKKFVRKVIPNEVSKIATVAAPFVAPFNPQLAATMAGIGSFDQTGSIGDSLKRAGITYAGGQLARAAGGAGFQDPSMSLQGFTNLTSPTSGATIFGGFGGPKTSVQGIPGVNYSDMSQFNKLGLGGSNPAGIAGTRPDLTLATGDGAAMEAVFKNVSPKASNVITKTAKDVVTEAATDSSKGVFQLIKEKNYGEAAKTAAKKGFDAIFLDDKGRLDKNLLLAAGSFGLTYADAKKIADDAGEDIGTEEEYDEATKAEKKDEYASYLTNFFEGRKDGGRIGFALGTNELRQMAKEMFGKDDLRLLTRDELDQLREEFDIKKGRVEEAQGGRIGFRFGDKVEDEEGILAVMDKDKDDEDMDDLMAGTGINFSRQEKSYLFRRLGGAGGADRSYTMPNLYRILSNPSRYPEDARVLKQIAIMGLSGKKDGGRIGAKDGFSFMELIDDEAYNKRLQEKEDLINELMDKGYRFEDIMQLVSPRTKRLMDDGTYKEYGDAPSISLGKIGLAMGGEVPVRKNKAGIEELDYRQTGGFVPVGVKEKADDVPAMLSKNEFVLTADAVRGIGGGDVEKGAEKLYGVMKQAEKVGRA